jgi:hypothetical protein
VLLAAACLALGPVAGTGATPARKSLVARPRPALVGIDAASAELVRKGRTLRLSGVAPEASFDAQGEPPEVAISAFGAMRLLDTQRSVVAVVRGAPGVSDDTETERVTLSRVRYDPATGTLTADIEPVAAKGVRGALKEEVERTDADHKLPSGPVELLGLDTDTRVAGSGQPQPLARSAQSGSSYNIGVVIEYSQRLGAKKIEGTFQNPSCTRGSNFTVNTDTGDPSDKTYDATSFEVITDLDCFFGQATAEYSVKMTDRYPPGGQPAVDGPILLKISQIAPRSFVTTCEDKDRIKSECDFDVGRQRVKLHL